MLGRCFWTRLTVLLMGTNGHSLLRRKICPELKVPMVAPTDHATVLARNNDSNLELCGSFGRLVSHAGGLMMSGDLFPHFLFDFCVFRIAC